MSTNNLSLIQEEEAHSSELTQRHQYQFGIIKEN